MKIRSYTTCKEYEVEVRETLSRKVKVTAENEEAAVSAVEDMYCRSEIILDAEDYVGVEYLNVKEIDDYDR